MESLSLSSAVELQPERVPEALVIGSGLASLITFSELSAIGFNVCILEPPDQNPEDVCCSVAGLNVNVVKDTLRSCVDQDSVYSSERWPSITRDESGFCVDTPELRSRRFDTLFFAGSLMTLEPGLSIPGFNQSATTTFLDAGIPSELIFLMDHPRPTDPAAAMAAILKAIQNVDAGGHSTVLFRNAAVRHIYGETLYDAAKSVGVMFYRLGKEAPGISVSDMEGSGTQSFTVFFQDIIEHGTEISLTGDKLFVITGPDPESIPDILGDFLHNDRDGRGFLVSDSIHGTTFKSFCNGIYCVGGYTGATDLLSVTAQAKAAAANARAYFLSKDAKPSKLRITIADECVRCLTCHRICPHSAIWPSAATSKSVMKSIASACLECGICVSECPRVALDLIHFPEEAFSGFLDDISGQPDKIVVYGCSRSAGRAFLNIELPPDVIFFSVPCAGRVSESVILDTIRAGVRGLLVIGCHHGNCASSNGTDWACERVRTTVSDFLVPAGVNVHLAYDSLAPNEPKRLERIIREFSDKPRNV